MFLTKQTGTTVHISQNWFMIIKQILDHAFQNSK
jgi:hypothetical protein